MQKSSEFGQKLSQVFNMLAVRVASCGDFAREEWSGLVLFENMGIPFNTPVQNLSLILHSIRSYIL